jgi:hypothetical protein
MPPDTAEEEQYIQEPQYQYPRSGILRAKGRRFIRTMLAVADALYWRDSRRSQPIRICLFDSLLDIRCGDRRLIQELAGEYLDINTLGVDYSKQPIEMPWRMSSCLGLEIVDFLERELNWQSDTVTAIEISEHISPDQMYAFISRMADAVIERGRMVVTVSRENEQIQDKHYQHFSEAGLAELLIPWFDSVIPLNRQSKLFTALELAVGGRDNRIVVNSPPILNALWGLYNQRYLYAPSESKCKRIAVVCEK